MPQIKKDFSGGKMNKDLDERILPDGQYRDAMNIQVRTTGSDSSSSATDGGTGNAGAVQNIKGNVKIVNSDKIHYEKDYGGDFNVQSRFVGQCVNEKDNSIYHFIASPDMQTVVSQLQDYAAASLMGVLSDPLLATKIFVDTIVEYKTEHITQAQIEVSESITPVVVDYYGAILPKTDLVANNSLPSPQGWVSATFSSGMGKYFKPGMIFNAYNISSQVIISNVDGSGAPEVYAVDGDKVTFHNEINSLNWNDVRYVTLRAPRVLNFPSSTGDISKTITGINIVDDLLFWTDNQNPTAIDPYIGEPKKINITRCKAGSEANIGASKWIKHTQIKLKDPNDSSLLIDYVDPSTTSIGVPEQPLSPSVDNNMKPEHVTVIRKAPTMAPTVHMKVSDREGTTVVNTFTADFGSWNNPGQEELANIALGSVLTIPFTADLAGTGDNDPELFNLVDYQVNDIITFTEQTWDSSNSWITAVIDDINWTDDDPNTTAVEESGYKVLTIRLLTINQELTPIDIDEATGEPTIDGQGDWTITLEERDPLFELKFGRFSTRYRYVDGEYSNFGPWSEIAFLPGPFLFDHKNGYNKGMSNTVRSLTIEDFIPHQRIRSSDMVAVDLLYKNTESPNVYIVKTITKGRDPEWDRYVINNELDDTKTSFGRMNITSEMIYKTVANNQNLRAWDNVPRSALAQEIAANRLVYSNYVQGYEIINKPGLIQNLKNYTTPTSSKPLKSMKTIRDYQVGIVYGDKYGRETPVFSPGYLNEIYPGSDRWEHIPNSFRVPKTFSAMSNTVELKQLWGETNEGIPDDWISYVKYYIKETSNEYYNVVMDRWYDAEDGNVWISFASADRNKIDEDTYLILKNKHGQDEAVTEKARYKVIAIENEAPDFIKRKSKSMGTVDLGTMAATNSGSGPLDFPQWEHAQDMFGDSMNPLGTSPIELMSATEMRIAPFAWNGFLDSYSMVGNDSELEFRWKATSGSQMVAGNTWRTLTYFNKIECDDDDLDCEDDGLAGIRWDKPFEDSADMFDLLVNAVGTNPLPDITYIIEFREMAVSNKPEFDGKFFVKLEKDDMLMTTVLNLTGIQTEYNIADSFAVGYLDNSEYNPSSMECQYCDDTNMPRRNYKWMNQAGVSGAYNPLGFGDGGSDTDALYGFEETFTWTDGSTEVVSTNASYSNAGGGTNIGEQNVTNTQASNLVGTAGGTNSAYPGTISSTRCNNSSSRGCHPYDAEFMALGCWATEDSPSSGYGEDNIGSLVYNRTVETHRWWEWFMQYAQGNSATQGGTGTKIWIDGMRSRKMKGVNPNDLTANYLGWKPGGLNPGVISSTGSDGNIFNSTGSQLGRLYFAMQGTDWPGDVESDEYRFKQAMTSYGTLFRFLKDPTNTVYMIVGTAQNGGITPYSGKNHGQIGWGTSGTIPQALQGDSDIYYGPFFNSFESRNPIHANGYQTPDSVTGESWENGIDTFITVGAGCDACDGPNSTNQTNLIPGNPLGENGTCYRIGYRVEFRRFDTQGGGLANSENGTGDLGIDTTIWDPRGLVCHDGRQAMRIAILSEATSGGEVVIPTRDPAIWETEPKEDVGLDIYYEASNAIPNKLTSENTANFAPYNSRVRLRRFENGGYNYSYDQTSAGTITNGLPQLVVGESDVTPDAKGLYVKYLGYTKTNSIVGLGATQLIPPNLTNLEEITDGFLQFGTYDGGIGVPYGLISLEEDTFFTFTHPDGTVTMAKIVSHMQPINKDGEDLVWNQAADQGQGAWMDGNYVGLTQTKEALFRETDTQTGFFKIDSDVWKYPVELSWHNCWSYGNGVESDRIRDDFNANQVDNGVKVSSVLLDYGRERRGSGMIYSGIYNSTSGTNKLNEFNMAEKITKDINPSYGSIQALKTRDTDMVVLTEDKVLKVTTNKDALYNADGNPQLLASNRVLGTAVPFSGDYGISKNPESLSWDQYRLYFTDMQRGAVMRLSRDGLTPISNVGMKSWFRDQLPKTNKLLGTFDVVNGEYNLTLNYKQSNDAKTVSFSEESKGWVSFKSFIPQVGGSVGGKYITAVSRNLFNVGNTYVAGVYRHYEDVRDNTTNRVKNRNTFYPPYNIEEQTSTVLEKFYKESEIWVTFNDMPSVVKNFRAVNYEGTQAKVNRFITYNGKGDNEYYNLDEKDGWTASEIRTDRSFLEGARNSGEAEDFKDKEGKWFSHIKGATRPNWSNLSYSPDQESFYLKEFSMQGLGTSIEEPIDPNIITGCMDESANNYDPAAEIACDDCCDYTVNITATGDMIDEPTD